MKARNMKRRRHAKMIRGAFIGLIILLIITAVVFTAFWIKGLVGKAHADDIPIPVNVVIDGLDCSELSSQEAAQKLNEKHPWSMTVKYKEETYPLDNQLQSAIADTVDKAYAEADAARANAFLKRSLKEKLFQKEEDIVVEPIVLSYDIEFPDISSYASTMADTLSSKWGTPATHCDITEYDEEKDSFSFSEGHDGLSIDAEKLVQDINAAMSAGNYGAVITALDQVVSPGITPSDFKIIGDYTTHTTANSDRNTNVRLAAEAVNGTIVKPGETFSFNEAVGPRTEEKGYKKAPAYADGQTVQEYGGGVCQISSTLYNAVIAAGLRTDERTGHTFEPSYVTPGQDATVSYAKPDFEFTNTSEASIGILARYADRVATVQIFGIPVLEEGITRHLESEKTGESEPPEAVFTEDPFLPFGAEVIDSKGSSGSAWKTYIVTEKDGKEIDREYLHQTHYKGHTPTGRRNTQFPWNVTLPQGDAAQAQQQAAPQQ